VQIELQGDKGSVLQQTLGTALMLATQQSAAGGGATKQQPFGRGAQATFQLPPVNDCGQIRLVRIALTSGDGQEVS